MPGSAEDFGIKKKTVSWDLNFEQESRLSELAEARPVVSGGGRTWWVSEGKISIERNCVSLSLHMSKNLKLKKVDKSLIPEPISCISGFPRNI